jgi:anaerobic selenocysteine-containing dehydrogenase
MNKPLAPTIRSSVCPHDCPSTCALEVEVLDTRTIGRVYGADDNDYTAGVVCAKVARYAERLHHPDRLLNPLRRVGDKGNVDFRDGSIWQRIAWDDALDIVAERFRSAVMKYGSENGVALFLRRHHGPGAA